MTKEIIAPQERKTAGATLGSDRRSTGGAMGPGEDARSPRAFLRGVLAGFVLLTAVLTIEVVHQSAPGLLNYRTWEYVEIFAILAMTLAFGAFALAGWREFSFGADQRERAEEALRRSEQQLRLITDNLPAAISYVDSKQHYRFNNKTYELWFGRSVDDMRGRHIREILGEPAYEKIRGYVETALSGQHVTYETVLPLKDAGTRHLSVIYAPCSGPGGGVEGFLALVTDISERKRAEEAQRESEERIRSTLDGMMEGCQIIGFDWRYLYVNDAVAKHGRRAKEELLGHTMMEMYPGIEDTEMFAHLQRCMEERIPHRMENEFTYPDGDTAWFELAIQPVPEGIFILSLDITERKRAEEALQAAREEIESRVEHRMRRGNPYGLTFRELTVLHLVAAGESDRQIGVTLGISPLTAQKHISNILAKMKAPSRTAAGVRAVREGLLE